MPFPEPLMVHTFETHTTNANTHTYSPIFLLELSKLLLPPSSSSSSSANQHTESQAPKAAEQNHCNNCSNVNLHINTHTHPLHEFFPHSHLSSSVSANKKASKMSLTMRNIKRKRSALAVKVHTNGRGGFFCC